MAEVDLTPLLSKPRYEPQSPKADSALQRLSGPERSGVKPPLPKPWQLLPQGLAVFHGSGETARLSHYFLPRLLVAGKRVLFLDGANAADPRLLERLARQRSVPFAQFSRQIQIARAFTCFQLTELIARVPRFLADFPAQVLIVTAFPDLYFDEDVRDWDARVAFEQALRNLQRWAGLVRATFAVSPTFADRKVGATRRGGQPLSVAVFSAATTFTPSPARRRFFERMCTEAAEVWKFSLGEDNKVALSLETAARIRMQGLVGAGFKPAPTGARSRSGWRA